MFESRKSLKIAAGAVLLFAAAPASAEDGYRLWLRYEPVEAAQRTSYAARATEIVVDAHGPTGDAAASELKRGLSGLLGTGIISRPRVDRDGAIVLALARTADLGRDGFRVQTTRFNG